MQPGEGIHVTENDLYIPVQTESLSFHIVFINISIKLCISLLTNENGPQTVITIYSNIFLNDEHIRHEYKQLKASFVIKSFFKFHKNQVSHSV